MVLRRLLFALSVVLLEDYPIFQVNLYFQSSFCSLAYLLKYQPFENRKMNLLELFNEMNVYIASLHLVALINLQESDEVLIQRQNIKLTKEIGYSFIFVSCIQIAINLIFLFSDFFSSLCNLCRKFKLKIKGKVNFSAKAKIHDTERMQQTEWLTNRTNHIIQINETKQTERHQELNQPVKKKLKTKKRFHSKVNSKATKSQQAKKASASTTKQADSIENNSNTNSFQVTSIQPPQPYKFNYQNHFAPRPPHLHLSIAKAHPKPSSQIQGLSISQVFQVTNDSSFVQGQSFHKDESLRSEAQRAYEKYSMQIIKKDIASRWYANPNQRSEEGGI
ncbi:hypothetical protein FGO68_gene17650 [Halteria grandinella]|uniref:Transmembrane protein n=1 Tax=Halteria grandinella TaxID=5974 RepID=A0A8J8P1M5_HALGN|nr:hypothetical protein FGO68_gene17650 [Halteria grandinella]